ncbi:MAG TPA: type I phosphomannose isomerase catalytic subunit [Gammaproteobacteria bacterium]|nr:type I phosphomannose isomerase catalytic subunit [Gammaproteobacteria bacterium]
MPTDTLARALLAGDRGIAATLASKLLQPLNDNFVERPWGGRRMQSFKNGAAGAPAAPDAAKRFGECFEIAADDADAEARQYPSRIRLDDGSEVSLPALLEVHAEVLLGERFVRRHGRRFPLLPKTLDVAELLSVQGHPEGNTEVYVIIAADEGATLRLGFNADVDGADLAERCAAGRRTQQRLLDVCGADVPAPQLQNHLQPWFANRGARLDALEDALGAKLGKTRWNEAAALLRSLHALYWHVLDLMNAVPARPGAVINNSTPLRLLAGTGKPASAEVHALGNTEGREILALEIRRPGVTFRAWDNVRFPIRDVDVEAAIGALNLRRTAPEDYVVVPQPVAGRPGVKRSVVAEHFSIEHLEPTPLASVDVPPSQPHCLHALEGAVSVYATDGTLVGRLRQGDSAIVPIGVGAYRVAADAPAAAVVKVDMPVDG